MGFKAVYNYLDFTADKPFLDVYDITPCFSDKNKLNFQVRFPGINIVYNIYIIYL